MITQEHEYYLRFILLLIQGGTELLREIAAKALQKCNTPLNIFLSKNASVIQHTKDISKKQKDILYPSSPTVVSEFKDYDITLLSYLITNFLTGNLDSNEKNAVDKIKEMRNVYHAHTSEAKMTATTYTKEWNKLMRIICTVSQNLPEEKRNRLSEIIDSIENEQLDIKVVIDEIKKLDQTNDFFENITKSLDELNQNMDARFSKIEKEILELRLKMENQGKKTKVVNTVRGQVTLSADEQETVDYAAEKLLLEASKDYIEKSQTEDNKLLTEKVGNFVEDVEKLDIKVEHVSEGSIVFEFKCFSLSALLDLINYFNSAKFKARLHEIAAALEDITGKKINISGSLDIQSFQDVITEMQVKRYEKVVNFEMECTGVDGLLHAIEIFEGGKAENSLNELSTALSESVGKPVTLHTSIDIDQMQRAIDSIREDLDNSESEETSKNHSKRDDGKHNECDTVMTLTDTVADAVGDVSIHGNSVASLKPFGELKVESHSNHRLDYAVKLNRECTDGKTSQAENTDSDMAYSRSVLSGSDEDYSRSVLSGSDEDYSRSVLSGSDEDYSRSVLFESAEDYSRSVLFGSAEDYSRSVLFGSDLYFSRSLLGGSQKVQEIHCELCMREGNTVYAVKHCVNCAEYLCRQCFKSHTRFKAFQNHETKDVGKANPSIIKNTARTVSKSVQAVSKLQIEHQNEQQSSRPSNVKSSEKPTRKVKAELVSTIKVRTSGDKHEPYIHDLTIVHTYYCVVTDKGNMSVKVVDPRGTVISKLLISEANQLSITSVNDRIVAVAVNIHGESKLLFLSVSTSGIISNTGRAFDIKYDYFGIIHHNDYFYATWINGIDIFSMSGQTLKQITNNSFGVLYGIVLSNDHNTIYVCSFTKDTVFSVDLKGNIKATYKDKDLQAPDGVTVDNEGYLYVCSTGTGCVHQLTADLNRVQVIISGVGVTRCTFDRAENRLFIKWFDKIRMYDMNYE